jgi:rhodanese-related sulfurtransferase
VSVQPPEPLPSKKLAFWGGALLRAGILAIAGAAGGLVFNAVRTDQVALALRQPAKTCLAPEAASSVEQLTPSQVTELCSEGVVTVVDVRPEARFEAGHVAGAVHLPCTATTGAADNVLDNLVGNGSIVLYGEGTEDALEVAQSLARRAAPEAGKVAVLVGGFHAWDQAGLACSSGPCEHCEVSRSP